MDIKAEQIEPPPAFGGTEVDTTFILGVGKAEKRVIFLLDINRVLTDGEVKQMAKAA